MNPQQQTLQEYYENLINRQSQETNISPDTHKQLITQFHNMNRSIQFKLQNYTKLISTYIDKVQNSFLLSFTKVLQKMGNDLMLAEQTYKSIDKEIMTNQKCVNLAQDKIFFINESNYYQQEFLFKSKQVNKLKQKNYLLIKQNTGLKEKLFQKVKENMFYKQKCKKLQKLRSDPVQNLLKLQEKNNQTTPPSPSKISVKSRQEKSEQKKWASYGRQTLQQKRQKQEEKKREKKNLLVDIRKQLKTRQKINLEQIVNCSLIKNQQKIDLKPLQLKKFKISERTECYTDRTSRKSVQKQCEHHNKSMFSFSSTVASNFPHSYVKESSNQRSLNTSTGKRQVRNQK